MLHLTEQVPALDAASRYALDTLVDLSRLLRAETDAAVELRVVNGPGAMTLEDCRRREWGIAAADGVVTIERAGLALLAEVVGAIAEQRSTAADRYGRVPPSVNALVARGIEREPHVNHAASALRAAALRAARGPVALVAPWPDGKRWAIAMTHDLDVVSGWPAFAGLRLVELLRKGETGRFLGVLASAGRATLAGGDPVSASAAHVIATVQSAGIRSTWFVITGTPTLTSIRQGDVTYTPESPRAVRIIRSARDAGAEVGLHGSFETYVTTALFARQRDRLRAIVGDSTDIRGVRQHFLRMRPGVSHRAMQDAGFRYDSTFGFPDRNGFRLGVADVVRVWHDAGGAALDLEEVPFIWMDRALSKYRGVEDPGAWIDDALALARICESVEGVWTGIWHPNLSDALGFPGAPRAFERLVREIMARSPWSATMGEIVTWRRARRDARAAGRDGSGRIRLRTSDPRVRLEDGTGRPLATVPD